MGFRMVIYLKNIPEKQLKEISRKIFKLVDGVLFFNAHFVADKLNIDRRSLISFLDGCKQYKRSKICTRDVFFYSNTFRGKINYWVIALRHECHKIFIN